MFGQYREALFLDNFLMDANQLDVSCCQRCRHFTLEGRRGGHCSQLNVPVQGGWTACSLASPVFLETVNTVTQSPMATWPQGLKVSNHDFDPAEQDCLVEAVQ